VGPPKEANPRRENHLTARTSRQSMLEQPQLWNQTRGKKTYVHQAKPANPARKSISLSVMGIISESSGDKTVCSAVVG
jgi:hypothetical protein